MSAAHPTEEREVCMSRVRWFDGKLQQRWCIQTVTAGAGSVGLIVGERFEWRDVPHELSEVAI